MNNKRIKKKRSMETKIDLVRPHKEIIRHILATEEKMTDIN
jgi:hypothetical protein